MSPSSTNKIMAVLDSNGKIQICKSLTSYLGLQLYTSLMSWACKPTGNATIPWKATGTTYRIKVVWRNDLDDDCIIDVWALQPPSTNTAEEVTTTQSTDPLSELVKNFPEIVDPTDDREFLNFTSDETDFSQSELDEDKEEFLTTDELSSDEE